MMKCESSCLNNPESGQTSSSSQIDALEQILGGPIVGVDWVWRLAFRSR